jgi:hypothetical protein
MLRLPFYLCFLLSARVGACSFHDFFLGSSPATTNQTTQERQQLRGGDYNASSASQHRELPEGFVSCGSSSPTKDEIIEMGLAQAIWDADFEHRRLKKNKKRRRRKKNKASPQEVLEVAEKDTTIPVYFHVFLNNAGKGRLESNEVEIGFMATLNSAMKDTPFHFQLKAVTNIVNETWFNCEDEEEFKPRSRVGGPESLNVFVCDMAGARNMGGMSSLPTTTAGEREGLDGILIMNPALGYKDFAHQALVHESGHWLGLFHTFEGGCNSTETHHGNYPSYYFAGDGVADTPAQGQPTSDIKAQSSCWQNDNLNTCEDAVGIDAGPDDVSNYMNYIPTECYAKHGHFTPGQMDRMVAEYEIFRSPNAGRFRL